jgi:PQQ-dependent catabolism-associated CXXCW motif protein
VVIDVLESKTRMTVPGAHWMAGVGSPNFHGAEARRFADALDRLSAGDKTRPLVFLCLSSECWLSYNAALRALEAGYKDVIWFRGGTDAWKGAGLDMKVPAPVSW